jgi:NMD protein affecting ribosome stability and mRNA decay
MARRDSSESKGTMHRWRRVGRGGGTRHDAYEPTAKLAEPSVCKTCGASYSKGRWVWGDAVEGAHAVTCPACRRIHDRFPAGIVRIEGDLGDRRQEMLNLLHNIEDAEKRDHALERIMHIQDSRDALEIATTGIHLARRFGEALQRTYHEHVDLQYLPAQDLVRVYWRRNEEERRKAP